MQQDMRLGRRRRWGKISKIIRRVHLYAGLIMLPWMAFFGVSGLLFNHPNLGETVSIYPVAPGSLGNISPWSPDEIAKTVHAQIEAHTQHSFAIVPSSTTIQGTAIFAAPAPNGRYTLLFDVEHSRGVVMHRRARESVDIPAFAGQIVDLGPHKVSTLESGASELLTDLKLDASQPLKASPRIAPKLRMQLADEHGVIWNVECDLRDGRLSGRRADEWPAVGMTQLLGKMHKTHHFPRHLGHVWVWVLFEDLLGITMVIWALTGLWMWWSIKPTRRAGAVGLIIALALFGVIMMGTVQELLFGQVSQVLGPG